MNAILINTLKFCLAASVLILVARCNGPVECVGRICANGGSVEEVGEGICTCSCVAPWGGENCTVCELPASTCQNGGTVNQTDCDCDCPDGFSGPNCEFEMATANAGNDVNVDLGETVTLDGSASVVQSNQTLKTEWLLIQKPYYSQVEIQNGSLIPDEPGEYHIQLKAFPEEQPDSYDLDTMIIGINPSEIAGFSPTAGPVDTLVQISGKNFSSLASGMTVWFTSSLMAAEIVNTSATVLEVRVPMDAETGPITLQIDETGQEIISIEDFIVTGGNYTTVAQSVELLSDIAFFDQQVGLIVGGRGTIMRTIDGGQSWTDVSFNVLEFLTSVDIASPQVAYACGSFGTLLRSEDAGQSWSLVDLGSTVNLRGVSFANVDTGYVVGDWGTVFMTYDGGQNWSQAFLGGAVSINAVAFATAKGGTLAGTGGNIRATTDAGMSLFTPTAPALGNIILRDIAWADPNWIIVGDALNGEGTILRSTDGGGAYSLVPSGTDQQLISVSFWGADNGLIVGKAGTILRTEDAGASWSHVSLGLTLDLDGVYLKSAQEAIILAGQKVIVIQL